MNFQYYHDLFREKMLKDQVLSMWCEHYANYGMEMRDAAEFEALVAAKMADVFDSIVSVARDYITSEGGNPPDSFCPLEDMETCRRVCGEYLGCDWCVLKRSRIDVEAEMDKEAACQKN